MARAEANKEYNSFVAGLITEASPLTYPENASIDEENFILSRKGSRRRRLGMDYETNFVLTDTELTPANFAVKAVSTFEWKNVNDDPTVGLLIVQIGNKLYFYDLFDAASSRVQKNLSATITLDNAPEDIVQFAPIVGRLVITTGTTKITVLEYDEPNDTIISTQRNLYIRDLLGVDDGLGTSKRPAALSDTHNYNLQNQGWSSTNINAFKSSQGVYPSNADIMHLGKDANEDFDATVLIKQNFGSTPAAKGKNILDAFARGSTRNTKGSTPRSTNPFTGAFTGSFIDYEILTDFTTPTLPEDETLRGCKTIAHYAGRLWYSGAQSDLSDADSKSPNLGSYIFFSQIADNLDKISICHSEADPTSEHISDIIDSDGGTIKITEASDIIKLVPVADGLVVFASNGVWQVVGGDSGFSATAFQVIKISDIGTISAASVVAVDNVIFYWAKAGIYLLQPDQISARLTGQNISEQTIQTLYNEINRVVKNNVVGIYDDAANQVRWLYTADETYDGVNNRYAFDKELIFDITLRGFFKSAIKSIPTKSPVVGAYINIEDIISTETILDVVSNGDDVITVDGDDVVSPLSTFGRGVKSIKYLAIVEETTMQFTASLYNNTDFLDWRITNSIGVDANAFLITGFDTFQDTQRSKKATYITTHMEFTETGFDANLDAINSSSCLLQAQWEWANSVNSGRFSTPQQIYRLRRQFLPSGSGDPFDYGFDVVTARSKLRGKGRALSLKFTTEPAKDCVILGWGLNITGEVKV